eukprot:2532214-Rhodomonas_salina.1
MARLMPQTRMGKAGSGIRLKASAALAARFQFHSAQPALCAMSDTDMTHGANSSSRSGRCLREVAPQPMFWLVLLCPVLTSDCGFQVFMARALLGHIPPLPVSETPWDVQN